jgi:hypothetical protein
MVIRSDVIAGHRGDKWPRTVTVALRIPGLKGCPQLNPGAQEIRKNLWTIWQAACPSMALSVIMIGPFEK